MSASQELRKLAPEEKRVIINKGTEMPFIGKHYAFWGKALMFASVAAPNFTAQRTSLKLSLGGQALIRKFPVQSKADRTMMAYAQRLSASTVEPTSAMSLSANTLQPRTHGTASTLNRWISDLTSYNSNLNSMRKEKELKL